MKYFYYQTSCPARMNKAGFTLIEMSIVLVIIGLIIGGVLTGRSLIESAQRRAILSELEHYKTAVNTFRSKYNAIPGDMANATTFFGSLGGGYSSVPGDRGSSLTYNGDGDGIICNGAVTYSDLPCDDEPFLFWKHLANAGLINSAVTGTLRNLNGVNLLEVTGENLPASAVNSTFTYIPYYLCLPPGGLGLQYFPNNYCGHVIAFGTSLGMNAGHNWADLAAQPAISTFDAQAIDSKIDDGKPATGAVSTFAAGGNAFDPNCATSSSMNATYNLALGGPQCSLLFGAGF